MREYLRKVPLLAGISDGDLDNLIGLSREVTVPAGTRIIEEGTPGAEMFIVLEGEVEITKQRGTREELLAVRGAGEFLGEMAILKKAPRYATVTATQPARLLVISQNAFGALISCSTTVPLEMLHTVLQRLQNNESILQQAQRMELLGSMAAGLAHELNNPAAAIARSAAQMNDALHAWESASLELSRSSPDETTLAALERASGIAAAHPAPSDPLALADREDAVTVWLEDHDVDRAWELGPALVAHGWDDNVLDDLAGAMGPDLLGPAVRWLAAMAGTRSLLDEIHTSAQTMSGIVTAVKEYTFLDQAPIQEIDVHKTLETTLTILKGKLKSGITVRREYDPALPTIDARGSELNQVWTNLIDNAIDAMNGQGTLTIRTYQCDGSVCVDIEDTGPGIPEEIQPRIFEEFFTTKGPGKGTGIGLHVSAKIIHERHRGRIDLTSRPGHTRFHVVFPPSASRR